MIKWFSPLSCVDCHVWCTSYIMAALLVVGWSNIGAGQMAISKDEDEDYTQLPWQRSPQPVLWTVGRINQVLVTAQIGILMRCLIFYHRQFADKFLHINPSKALSSETLSCPDSWFPSGSGRTSTRKLKLSVVGASDPSAQRFDRS